MTPCDIAKIRERAEKATPGPYIVRIPPKGADKESVDIFAEDNEHWVCSVWISDQDDVPLPQIANADFIAHAREDVPALCAEVEALRVKLDNAKLIIRSAAKVLDVRRLRKELAGANEKIRRIGRELAITEDRLRAAQSQGAV